MSKKLISVINNGDLPMLSAYLYNRISRYRRGIEWCECNVIDTTYVSKDSQVSDEEGPVSMLRNRSNTRTPTCAA